MSKNYVGTGYQGPARCDVHIEQDGQSHIFRHRAGRPNVEYQWDGGGPGSTDLARALLWEVTGVDPEWKVYRLFKSEVVATWPMRLGECWRISEQEIKRWLVGVEQDMALAESASRTEARQGQMRDRELRLKGFAQVFRRKT